MVGWGRVEALPPALLFVDTGLAGAGVKLAESVIKEAAITLEEDKASEGAGGAGTLKVVPYTVRRTFGFHLAGMVGHEFFKPYAVTFDFETMQTFLR